MSHGMSSSSQIVSDLPSTEGFIHAHSNVLPLVAAYPSIFELTTQITSLVRKIFFGLTILNLSNSQPRKVSSI